jgi:heat shock protein HtpX
MGRPRTSIAPTALAHAASPGVNGAIVTPFLDPDSQRAHRARNTLHSAALVGGLGLLTAFSAWLIWGPMGVATTLVVIGLIYAFAPRLPPQVIMRMFRARQLDPRHGGQIVHIVDALSDRAELSAPPRVFVIPSMTLNAFATGTPQSAVIGITEGLLRRLTLREVAGVLAHEISHIRNNDLAVMGLADVMTRFTQMLAYLAVFLALFNLPAFILGDAEIPLTGLALLYLAPTVGSLIQLALSRTREHDADLEGASLTGDPEALASALEKLERYQGHFWEDMRLPVPGRRIPQPSLLRSHPRTEDRVARLRALGERPMLPQIPIAEEPMVSLVGLGPIAMRPRYRWTGVWY